MKEFWNQRYSEEDLTYGREANDFLKKNFHHFKTKGKILCLAEGQGRNALFLARREFKVTAVDMSEVGMKKAKELSLLEKVELTTIVSDLENFDMGENEWDGIVSIFGHFNPLVRSIVHQKIERSLRPQGIFLMEAYTPRQLSLGTGGPRDPTMFMTRSIIEKELSNLQPEFSQEVVRFIKEGKYHDGESAVIQFIGKKQ